MNLTKILFTREKDIRIGDLRGIHFLFFCSSDWHIVLLLFVSLKIFIGLILNVDFLLSMIIHPKPENVLSRERMEANCQTLISQSPRTYTIIHPNYIINPVKSHRCICIFYETQNNIHYSRQQIRRSECPIRKWYYCVAKSYSRPYSPSSRMEYSVHATPHRHVMV